MTKMEMILFSKRIGFNNRNSIFQYPQDDGDYHIFQKLHIIKIGVIAVFILMGMLFVAFYVAKK